MTTFLSSISVTLEVPTNEIGTAEIFPIDAPLQRSPRVPLHWCVDLESEKLQVGEMFERIMLGVSALLLRYNSNVQRS